MNDLSWMIYLADVAGGIGGGISIVFFAAVIMAFGTIASVSISADQGGWGAEAWALWRKFLWRSIIVAAAAFVVGTLTPSSETIYAIAASEMGETALNTETGGKAIEALNSWLDRQISDGPEK